MLTLLAMAVILFILTYAQEPIIVQQASIWPALILALVGGLPATISAIIAGLVLLQSSRNAEVAAETDTKVGVALTKTDTIIEQGVQIHTLTNSNLSKVNTQLDVANERIKGMEELIKSMVAAKTVADDLSTKKAEMGASTPPSVTPNETPVPVADDQVADLIKGDVTKKLDTLQETADKDKT